MNECVYRYFTSPDDFVVGLCFVEHLIRQIREFQMILSDRNVHLSITFYTIASCHTHQSSHVRIQSGYVSELQSTFTLIWYRVYLNTKYRTFDSQLVTNSLYFQSYMHSHMKFETSLRCFRGIANDTLECGSIPMLWLVFNQCIDILEFHRTITAFGTLTHPICVCQSHMNLNRWQGEDENSLEMMTLYVFLFYLQTFVRVEILFAENASDTRRIRNRTCLKLGNWAIEILTWTSRTQHHNSHVRHVDDFGTCRSISFWMYKCDNRYLHGCPYAVSTKPYRWTLYDTARTCIVSVVLRIYNFRSIKW